MILDSNEYIFGIPGDKASCAKLIDLLGELRVFVPSMIIREVRSNLQREYGLGKDFFRLISGRENITILWSDPPEELIVKYIGLRFTEEDAAIAACAEWVGAEYLISENGHFLQHSGTLVFETINAATALSLIRL